MALEQAGIPQPEASYDSVMQDDVRAAYAEVTKGTETEPAKTETVETEKPVETKTDERARDEQGRFVKTEAEKAAEAKVETKPAKTDEPAKEVILDKAAAKPAAEVSGEQPSPAKVAPPAGWSPKAKAQWDRLPQVIREEVGKASPAELHELKPFVDRAKQSGQTLTQALQSYTGIEDLIRRDIRQGFLHIAGNAGLTQHQAGQLFQTLAHQLGVAPQAPANSSGQTQPNGTLPADQAPDLSRLLEPAINPLTQRLSQLETMIQQQAEAEKRQRLGTATQVIEKFRQSPEHRYYDNVEQIIGQLLDSGAVPRTGDLSADLAKAYEQACYLDPEIREILITERTAKAEEDKQAQARAAAEKAKLAGKSVTGSPSPGSSIQSSSKRDARKSYDEDLHDDVLNAVRAVSARA